MPRIARVIAPRQPHHITQSGNRRQKTFFKNADYAAYIEMMGESCGKCGVEIWAYCLMPNHIHLIAAPDSEDALRRAIGEAHRRYTWRVNTREGWRGHLWQGRFSSFVMDVPHLLAAARYVELNPVRAGLVQQPQQWKWSSAAAHLAGRDDALVRVAPLLDMVREEWSEFLALPVDEQVRTAIRSRERTGRPLGSDAFVAYLEELLGRPLKPGKRGPKGKREA